MTTINLGNSVSIESDNVSSWKEKTTHLRFNDGKLEQMVKVMSMNHRHILNEPIYSWEPVESGSWPSE